MLGILDGTVLPTDEVRIPATDEGLLRGDGVFEVVRLYEGRPFPIDAHLARMERSAANLRLPLDVAAVRADIEALIEAGRPGDAGPRGLVTPAGPRGGVRGAAGARPARRPPRRVHRADARASRDARAADRRLLADARPRRREVAL